MNLLTLLERAGQDLNKGLIIVLPYAIDASQIVTVFDPPLGAVMTVVFSSVVTAEHAFKDKPKSGPEKLALVLQLVDPLIKQFMPDGKAATVLINAVVSVLNSRDENGGIING